jgi:hypothetical protein
MKNWEQFENYVLGEFLSIVPRAHRTPGSGSKHRNDSDIHADRYQIECKMRNTDGFMITKEAWKKLCYRAGMRAKIPALVVGKPGEFDEAIIVMRLRDFTSVVECEDDDG